jgi:cobalt/nickel transport system ATP-binding protein
VAGKPLDYSKRGLLALRQKVATTVFQDPDQQIFYTDIDSDIFCPAQYWRGGR